MTPPAPVRRRRRILVLLGLVAVPPLLLLYSCAIEPNWIEVTRHDVGTGSRELRVLHLTDLHFKTEGYRERRVLEIMAEEKPDLILITGDSVTSGFDAAGLAGFFSRLQAPLGVFACEGNWEDWHPGSLETYRKGGVTLLEDATAKLDGGLELVGLGSARSAVPSGDAALRIALCHYPVILPAAAAKGIDLVLAGHTHGGQVRIPFWGAIHTPFDSGDYEAGWYAEGKCRMYVSRGIGTSIVPFRFWCRPEVALIRVRFNPR